MQHSVFSITKSPHKQFHKLYHIIPLSSTLTKKEYNEISKHILLIGILMDRIRHLLNIDEIHKRGINGQNITVAVLDSGSYPHTDIKENIIYFKDFVSDRKILMMIIPMVHIFAELSEEEALLIKNIKESHHTVTCCQLKSLTNQVMAEVNL